MGLPARARHQSRGLTTTLTLDPLPDPLAGSVSRVARRVTSTQFFLRPECDFSGFVRPCWEDRDRVEEQVYQDQIAYALKQAETGTPVAEVVRRMAISEQTFYRWKKLYGGLGTGSYAV